MKRKSITLSFLVTTMMIAPAMAQTRDEPKDGRSNPAGDTTPSAGVLQEIVVTARRRDEVLSKVPVAVSVLTAEALARQGIRSEQDLQISTPGLVVQQQGSSNNLAYVIRGQTIDPYTSSPPAILTYVNDFQLDSPGSSALFDLASVQVLKGPQGTLFGRNTTGGAVLFSTTLPGDEVEGYVSGRSGNFDERQLEAAVSLPVNEKIALRVAGLIKRGGGFVKNLGAYDGIGGAGGNLVPANNTLGDVDTEAVRGTLVIRPSDTITSTTVAQYAQDDGTSIPSSVFSYATSGPLAGFIAPFMSGQTGPFAGIEEFRQWQFAHPYQTYTNNSWFYKSRSYFVSNNTNVQLSDELTLKSIVGYADYNRYQSQDIDATPWIIYQTIDVKPAQHNPHRQFSAELQLQGSLADGAVDFTLGGYYADVTNVIDNHLFIYGVLPNDFAFSSNNKSYAGFAQLTYNITDDLHLTGGFRYTWDDIDARQLPGSGFAPGGQAFVPGYEQEQSISFKKPSWTVGLDYQLNPELLLYIATRGSARTGGFNVFAAPISTTGDVGGNIFLPETTKDVEVGAKFNGYLGGMPITASVALYNQWVNDIQRASFLLINGNPALVTGNIPEAEFTGQEVNFSAEPAQWLRLGVQVAHLDARFTDGNTFALGNPISYGPPGNSPKWTGSVSADITAPLGQVGELILHGDAYSQSGSYFSNLGATSLPNTYLDGYEVANFRVSLEELYGTGVTVAAYIKNAFDKQYFAGGTAVEQANAINAVTQGRPRTYGLELRYLF